MKWAANKELDSLKRFKGYRHNRGIMHKDCGGQVMVDAEVKKRILSGFGDRGDGKFSVDYIVVRYWRGTCLKCGADGLFMVPGFKKMTKQPAGLNRKLAGMRG
jgi:hypothetical protein